MKSTNWKDITELFAIAAIVASLIFVGLQLKQSQKIAVAGQYQSRADAALEFYLARMESEYALAITAKNIIDDEKFGRVPVSILKSLESEGREMVATKYLLFRSNITMFDNYHFQYEQGYLTEGAWQAFRVRIKSFLSDDVFADFYRSQTTHYRSSFEDVCSQILAELDTASRLNTDQ